jgi:hypothetical protein
MGEQRQGATYFTFKGGLNTESSPLNAPPEDAAEILNVEITNKGTARKRKGIDFLPQLNSASLFVANDTDFTAEAGHYVLPAPSGISFRVSKSDGQFMRVFICQVGRDIYLYDQSLLATTRDMGATLQRMKVPSTWDDRLCHYKTIFIKDANRVYLLNPYMPLSYLYYDEEAQSFVLITETVYIRDLENNTLIDDTVSYNESTYRCIKSHLSSEDNRPEEETGTWREYWVHEGKKPTSGAPADWAPGTGSVVKVEEIVYSGTGDYESTTLIKTYGCILNHTSDASNKPPNETYWVPQQSSDSQITTLFGPKRISLGRAGFWQEGFNFLSGTEPNYRSNIKGLGAFDTESNPRGFSCGTFASGRLWLSGAPGEPNTVYFSQSIEGDLNYSRFYQWADPNNPDDPDVVETDGGTIKITGAEEVVGIADYRGGVLVLATNGVWYVTGSDGYFKATTYSIQKITDTGCTGRAAWKFVDDNVIYAGLSGVYAVQLDDVSMTPTVIPLSDKIKSFWTSIPRHQREACELTYNEDTFQLVIGLNFETPAWWSSVNLFNQSTIMRSFLIFDVKLKAWYKYQMAEDTTGYKLSPAALVPLTVNLTDTELVTVADEVVTANGEDVEIATTNDPQQTIIGVIAIQRQQDDTIIWSLCNFAGSETSDFAGHASYKEEYDGLIRSVPQPFGDIGHRKQIAYLHTAFDRVETGFDLLTRTYTNPGGCYYRILWDFAEEDSARTKYSAAYQAYKPNRYNVVNEDGEVVGISVVRNKHRIRGSGRAVSLQFETEDDRDFHLLGWQIDVYATEKV